MTIKLTNTLTGTKHAFTPKDPNRVTLYVCGPTVYDRAHIGNFRPLIVFDTLFRLLRRTYGAEHVIYASNITDIDDKIIQAAQKKKVSPADIADQFEHAYLQDAKALNALPPTSRPKATDFIPEMIAMMQKLEAKGAAYACPSGLIFRVEACANYGQLSKRKRENMLAGARIEPSAEKRDPADFYLWKASLPSDPPGAVWDSPWGKGRPGWHIECSAMCASVLGEQIDIHGGGIDLAFPHHENEMAQSECAHGVCMASFWMHNGYVRFEDTKMSKSLGNTLTLPELSRHYAPETVRMALLSAHYRKPLDWSDGLLKDCRNRLDRLYNALEQAPQTAPTDQPPQIQAVLDALCDDLNTPLALSTLSQLANNGADRDSLQAAGDALGLLQLSPKAWQDAHTAPPPDAAEQAQIEALLRARLDARTNKNWTEADRIRDQLAADGIEIKDTDKGQVWRKTR